MKLTVAIALVCGCVAGAAQAQQLDSRWSPWLGCWQLAGENVRVCVEPYQGTAGVRLNTRVENASDPVLAQTLVADGTRQPIAEADCSGWQQADWSKTGERLFARAELTCREGSARTVTGLSTIVNGIWIDIQGIEIAGRENIRVRRYRRADRASAARQTGLAPRLGATAFTLDDVKEASARVSPRVMEAALVETGAGFNLSSEALIDLDRAGVADSVIDAMVAISYPRQFVVDRPSTSSPGGLLTDIDDMWFAAYPFPYYPSYYSRYLYSPYLYSPFGYSYWGAYGYYPYGTTFVPGGVIPVTINPGDGGGGDGRAVNGVGYTRIRTRAEADAEAASGRRTSDSGIASGTSAPRGDSSSSSGSSAGASSSGFSSGSSSSDSGRTAQPR